MQTPSDKPRRRQIILHASGATRGTHPGSKSLNRQPTRQLRRTRRAPRPPQRTGRRRREKQGEEHCNASHHTTPPKQKPQANPAAPTTAGRRLQDAAAKPTAGHGAAAARSKTTSRTTPAATRANTALTSVKTEKLKPSRRIPKRDGNLRTSHLKRNPHHQVKHRNQRPPAPKDAAHKPKHSRQPHARRTSPTTPTPPQTQAGRRARRHAAEATPPPTQQDKNHQRTPKPHLHSHLNAPRNAPSDTAAPAT
jgi:hypothetical protein